MTQQPVLPSDLGRFADVVDVVLSRDGTRLAAAVSVPDVAANRYRRDVLSGALDGDEPLAPVDDAGRARRGCRAGRRPTTGWPGWSTARAAATSGWPSRAAPSRPSSPGGRTRSRSSRWSPDGGRLLFVVREPTDRAYYETPEDRRPPRRLTTLGYREDGVGWTVDRPRQAYLVDAGGERVPVRLSTGGVDDAEFGWHPDGRSVFFVSRRHEGADRSPVNAVFVQPLDGQPRRLTGTDVQHGHPVPSPDGAAGRAHHHRRPRLPRGHPPRGAGPGHRLADRPDGGAGPRLPRRVDRVAGPGHRRGGGHDAGAIGVRGFDVARRARTAGSSAARGGSPRSTPAPGGPPSSPPGRWTRRRWPS